jgi:DNA-binding transcriptional ArsR family regulator
MKDGPDISKTAAMMGDPARANMLMALMSGMSLTANELAREAGVTPSTTSGHLSQLEASGLVTSTKQGRYRYFKLADADVALAVEALVTVAARAGHLRSRPGPKNDAMRQARTCYDHLAGHAAVELFKHWVAVDILQWHGDEVCLSQAGRQGLVSIGIDVAHLEGLRRPLCRTCIDWSERQHHLGGSIGAAVLSTLIERGWACRVAGARTIRFQRNGETAFISWYSRRSMSAA